jgi:hypothetical protein
MRNFFYILSGAIGLLILILFFSNLTKANSQSFVVLFSAEKMGVTSGVIIFFSSIIGAIGSMLAIYGVYYDQIFGKKQSVWTGTQKENIAQTDDQKNWDSGEW